MNRRFTHVNEDFDCENCGRSVTAAGTGCRNHCPYCLHSKHVDINPGDRLSECQGLLKPISYDTHGKKGIVIEFRCQRCGFEGRNKALLEDPNQPDILDEILKLGQ